MVEVVDYGGGNMASLCRGLDRAGIPWVVAGDATALTGCQPAILPGVGSFGAVMSALRARGLDTRLRDLAGAGVPLLGICVGLQVLFESSEESAHVDGLGLLAGRVRRFTAGKVPQIGWNRIEPARPGMGLDAGYVYFVNSYCAAPEDQSDTLFTAVYYDPFCAAVQRGPMTAFQFHPEKSGDFGRDLLRWWYDAV